jgi:hypothetical protein
MKSKRMAVLNRLLLAFGTMGYGFLFTDYLTLRATKKLETDEVFDAANR